MVCRQLQILLRQMFSPVLVICQLHVAAVQAARKQDIMIKDVQIVALCPYWLRIAY